MKLTKETLKRIIKEELDNLNESLFTKKHVEDAFGGKAKLNKWGSLYAQGGDDREQAIEMAKALLGEKSWDLALLYADGGKYMSAAQKDLERAAGHSQYAVERRKATSRAELGKTIGQDNLEKLAGMGQKMYSTSLDIPASKVDRHNSFVKQKEAMLDAFGYPSDIFDKPFLSTKQMGAEHDDAMGREFLNRMRANFIFSAIDHGRVLRMTDFDGGRIDVVGYYDPGNMRDSISVHLVIVPQMILDPDTDEPLEYELGKEFMIQIEDSEDYYDPNSESQEELLERLEIQLHEIYGN